MNINKQNIDELLFDYFEEQLTPSQSDALMNFIHQNPEFEKDFVQWKKAYHHKEAVVEDFNIASTIKNTYRVSNTNTYFSWLKFPLFFGVGLVCGLVLNFNNTQTKNEAHTIKTTNKNIVAHTVAKKDNEASVTQNISRENNEQKTHIKFDTTSLATNTIELKEITNQDTVNSILLEKTIETPLKVDELTSAKTDSSLTKNEPVKKLETKKKKQKRSGIFSTTDKILPVNPNF